MLLKVREEGGFDARSENRMFVLCSRCPLWTAANQQSDEEQETASCRGNGPTRSQTGPPTQPSTLSSVLLGDDISLNLSLDRIHSARDKLSQVGLIKT